MGATDAKENVKKSWQELWQENYEGKGSCEELENRLKHLKKKNGEVIASYLPWAIVDRVFKFQGGKSETIKIPEFKENEEKSETASKKLVQIGETMVEVDRLHIRDEIDADTGVVKPKYMNSYFINVKATWNGQEYTEHYPLLSSTNQALSFWTQTDLNRAMQRAKVKAIAIVSGIGYKLFEDGDLQFEETEDTENKNVDNAKKLKEGKAKAKKTKEAKEAKEAKEKKAKEDKTKKEKKESVMDDTEEDTEEETKEESKEEETVDIPDDRDDVEHEIKHQFLTGGSKKATAIKKYLSEHGVKKVKGLSDEDVRGLYTIVK
jgi:hypothetical protein